MRRTYRSPASFVMVFCTSMVLFLAAGCGRNGTNVVVPTPPQSTLPTIADVLAQSIATQSTNMQVDAYTYFPSTPNGTVHRGSFDAAGCLMIQAYTPLLMDAPFDSTLEGLGGVTTYNGPARDAVWLIPITKEQDLPYHARYLGHLNDPAYAKCQFAERMFVIDQVVSVWEQEVPTPIPGPQHAQLPADFATWSSMAPKAGGYRFLYPNNWRVTITQSPETLETITLESPIDHTQQIVIQSFAGESYYDWADHPDNEPTIFLNRTVGVIQPWEWADFYQLSPNEVLQRLPVQKVVGYELGSMGHNGVVKQLIFNTNGHTLSFELHGTDPTVMQESMNTFMALILTLRFDTDPGPLPTPAYHDTIGAGPFVGDAEIAESLTNYRERAEQGGIRVVFTSDSKELLSEADARALNPKACSYRGHSDGIWVLTGFLSTPDGEGAGKVLVDGTTAKVLCMWFTGAVTPLKETATSIVRPTIDVRTLPTQVYPEPIAATPYPAPTN